ncbi:MAG: hypothetical protein JOZ44_08560 [Acidobacteria bacterium]|nr:hypothetical protein [Acidobacteriota bacterium]
MLAEESLALMAIRWWRPILQQIGTVDGRLAASNVMPPFPEILRRLRRA